MRVDATAGAFATLEAGYQERFWDGETHEVVRTWDSDAGVFLVCTCGRRIDGVDQAMVEKLHAEHVLEVT